MPVSFKTCLSVLSGIVAALVATHAQGQSVAPAEKIVVSYPSKSITNFPILETARQKGFFQREGLHVSLVYIRGGLDIQTLLTNDADFAMGSTTAVTAFVAGAPLRIVLSYNAHVDQGLYAQAKYRRIADLKGQPIGSLNPGGLVDTMVRRILSKNGLQPERDVNLLAMGEDPQVRGRFVSRGRDAGVDVDHLGVDLSRIGLARDRVHMTHQVIGSLVPTAGPLEKQLGPGVETPPVDLTGERIQRG